VHLDDALGYSEPQAGAALLAGNGVVGLLKLLKQLGLISCLAITPWASEYFSE
jgi:hypothetical protein